MGVSAHVLGPKALARLSRKTGLKISHAFNGYLSNQIYNVRVREGGKCRHYIVNGKTFEVYEQPRPVDTHFSTCKHYAHGPFCILDS